MKNWIVAASVTPAARAVIEATGGSVEVLHEAYPHLKLVTVVNALYHGRHQEDGYFAYELNHKVGEGNSGQGICWWEEDPTALTVYRWNGVQPDDPKLHDPEGIIQEAVRKRAMHDLATEHLHPTIEDIGMTFHGEEYHVAVQWTRADRMPDMPFDKALYTVTLLDDGELAIDGPEW
jgi:hypothetical protein